MTYINKHIDPAWKSYLTTPAFPSYDSGHSAQSGAASTVLTNMFGSIGFTDTIHTDHGLVPPQPPRTFGSFDAAANEAAISRLYGGIHYVFDNDDALGSGRCIGDLILENLQQIAVGRTKDARLGEFPGRSQSMVYMKLKRWSAAGNLKENIAVTSRVQLLKALERIERLWRSRSVGRLQQTYPMTRAYPVIRWQPPHPLPTFPSERVFWGGRPKGAGRLVDRPRPLLPWQFGGIGQSRSRRFCEPLPVPGP